MYRGLSGVEMGGIEWLDEVDGGSRDLWFSVVTALGAIINNPQNGKY